MFNLMRSQPVRLASAAARAFSTTAEVCNSFGVLFIVPAAFFRVAQGQVLMQNGLRSIGGPIGLNG